MLGEEEDRGAEKCGWRMRADRARRVRKKFSPEGNADGAGPRMSLKSGLKTTKHGRHEEHDGSATMRIVVKERENRKAGWKRRWC
jgi:hypothetical protein